MVEDRSPYVNRLTDRGADQAKQRICLRCLKSFASLGPGNRLCVKCARREAENARKVPANKYRNQAKRGRSDAN